MKLPSKLHRSLSASPPPSSPPSPGGSASSLPSSPSKKPHRFPFPSLSRSKKSASPSPPEISAASSPSHSTSSSLRSHRNGKAAEPSFASLSVRRDKGKMPESRMQEIQQVFAQFDRNGDGKISAEELRMVLVSLGDETTSDEAKLMVREVDMDGDGFLDLDEFVELNSRCLHGATEEEEMQAAFAIFDLDKNGYISAEELQTVLGRLGGSLAERTSVEDCKRMIRGVDRKGVGYVDFDDFKRMMTPLTF